jgi:magnesium-transporting ATPase (P-type)
MTDITNPHAVFAADCLVSLAATPDGLTAPEAARRLAEHGPNRLPPVQSSGPVVRFLRQFHHVLIYVLIGAALVTGALQHWVDTGVILAVVLANAVIGFIQEGKA